MPISRHLQLPNETGQSLEVSNESCVTANLAKRAKHRSSPNDQKRQDPEIHYIHRTKLEQIKVSPFGQLVSQMHANQTGKYQKSQNLALNIFDDYPKHALT